MSSTKTVVVSGAGSGIGRAAAHRLAADGLHVTAVGRRLEPLELLAKEIGQPTEVVAADAGTEAGGRRRRVGSRPSRGNGGHRRPWSDGRAARRRSRRWSPGCSAPTAAG